MILTYSFFAGLIFANVEGWSVVDAWYWAVISGTGVGYGDIFPVRKGPSTRAKH